MNKNWGFKEEVPIETLYEKITQLELEIQELKKENIETTNALYEIENRLQSQIDKYHPPTYNLKDDSLKK